LDPFYENKSDIQPDTVHADTHGQSAPIFGLAYTLGIQLMPRIRNWKHLTLYRPSKDARYEHIDALFSANVDWDLIATHLPDMLRVGISVAAGRITPSESWAWLSGRASSFSTSAMRSCAPPSRLRRTRASPLTI